MILKEWHPTLSRLGTGQKLERDVQKVVSRSPRESKAVGVTQAESSFVACWWSPKIRSDGCQGPLRNAQATELQ